MGVVRGDVGTGDFRFGDIGWYVRVDRRGWALVNRLGGLG